MKRNPVNITNFPLAAFHHKSTRFHINLLTTAGTVELGLTPEPGASYLYLFSTSGALDYGNIRINCLNRFPNHAKCLS